MRANLLLPVNHEPLAAVRPPDRDCTDSISKRHHDLRPIAAAAMVMECLIRFALTIFPP